MEVKLLAQRSSTFWRLYATFKYDRWCLAAPNIKKVKANYNSFYLNVNCQWNAFDPSTSSSNAMTSLEPLVHNSIYSCNQQGVTCNPSDWFHNHLQIRLSSVGPVVQEPGATGGSSCTLLGQFDHAWDCGLYKQEPRRSRTIFEKTFTAAWLCCLFFSLAIYDYTVFTCLDGDSNFFLYFMWMSFMQFPRICR